MNKNYIKILTLALVIATSACNSNKSADTAVEETAVANANTEILATLDTWLDEVEALGDLSEEKLASLETEFTTVSGKLDTASMTDEDKKAYDDIVERWNLLKRNNVAEGADMTEEEIVE